MRRILLPLILMLWIGSAFPNEVEIPEDAWGVWQVAETGTNSPLYFSQGVGQSIVDRENAACVRNFGEGYAIFDHADSELDGGVWNVNEMTVGGSAFLFRKDKPTKEFVCTAIYLAYSDGYKFIAEVDSSIIRPHKSDIICASCANDDGTMVYVAYYDLVGEWPE